MTEDRSERKLATVLFADLAGSTALADDQDPERTRARLERFYDAMAAEIEAAGGTVEKFAGDAVMAAFGAPDALEDHAERALHTALAMQRRLEQGLSLRIGVNTGEVVAGRAREGSSFVSGDAVNVAARLEQAAEPGQILVGERTAAAARGAFELGDERTVEAKGKSEGVRCRPLIRALTLMRTRGVGGLERAFVGRDAELERLQAAYRRAIERGRPMLVTVLGDAGLGKTRLMRELWERLAHEQPVVLLVEDVHWGEPPLLDLLERVARDVEGPLLLLVTARPGFARAWDPRTNAETIWLEPLPPETASTLVESLLAADLAP